MTAQETAVCMGFDAMRMALGLPTKVFTVAQVLAWLALMTKEKQAG